MLYKLKDKKYIPRLSMYISSFADIIQGILQLFTIPFGYGVSISAYVSEWRLKRMMELYKKEHGK